VPLTKNKKERSKGMTTYLNSQELLEEQAAKLLKATEKVGVEKFRHALLKRLAEERNNQPLNIFDAITFPKLNEVIEEIYQGLGYE